MKLEYQNRWLRLLIEFFPTPLEIRRFRVAPVRLESQTGRMLQREIAKQMRQREGQGTQ